MNAAMALWRAFFLNRQRLAFALVSLALLIKAFVPQGFMVMPSNGTIMVSICSGQGPQMVALDLGRGAGPISDPSDTRPADHPCAFSGLGMAADTGADILLLGLALAFVLARGFMPVTVRQQRAPSRLRPPLRAPPLFG